jgi:hypothetical protein
VATEVALFYKAEGFSRRIHHRENRRSHTRIFRFPYGKFEKVGNATKHEMILKLSK